MKPAKAREMKKNWPSVSQKAKKEISKIVEYIFFYSLFSNGVLKVLKPAKRE